MLLDLPVGRTGRCGSGCDCLLLQDRQEVKGSDVMNEYAVKTENEATTLQWFGETVAQVRQEVIEAGHTPRSIRFVREIPAKHETEKVVTWTNPPPAHCDLCGLALVTQFIDGKTDRGPWGCLCPTCHREHGCGLGTGRGQEYTLNTAGEWVKTAG